MMAQDQIIDEMGWVQGGWVRFSWGIEKMGDRAVPARRFCWAHYVAGHRYFVTAFAAVCECGESYAGPTS